MHSSGLLHGRPALDGAGIVHKNVDPWQVGDVFMSIQALHPPLFSTESDPLSLGAFEYTG
jgi:hypothetical protein